MPGRLPEGELQQLVARLEMLGAPKAFVALVVLVNFTANLGCFDSDFQYLEMFAGAANVWRAVSKTYVAARVGLTYADGGSSLKQNPMDFLSSAGFAICIWLVLQCSPEDFFGLLAVVCSSWTPMNIGTSRRSVANPDGNIALRYVREANCMCARAVLICLLIAARGGTFFLEQPGGSYMEFYEKMEYLFQQLPVYKISWWMGHYDSKSPKRHKAFTNNKWCGKFNLGKMNLKKFQESQKPEDKPTVRYIDSKGRSKFHGKPNKLKLTQIYPMRFGLKAVELMPKLKSKGLGMPQLPSPELLPSGPDLFNNMSWHSELDWSDAGLKPVLVYLKVTHPFNFRIIGGRCSQLAFDVQPDSL